MTSGLFRVSRDWDGRPAAEAHPNDDATVVRVGHTTYTRVWEECLWGLDNGVGRWCGFGLAWMLMLGAGLAVDDRVLAAQATAIPTTVVQDTVYRGDGTVASGTVLVSWPAFSTSSGLSVPAGSTSVTIGAGGALSVALVPNAGSNPMGSYYTAVYHLNDGTVTREYWVVPVSASPIQVSSIKSTVLPTSVAVQTVTKSYVDQAIAQAVGGGVPQAAGSPYVMITGDTMTGPLVLPGDPVSPLQASDKQYVDEQIAGVSGGGGQKVSTVPTATQTVVQPAGTQTGRQHPEWGRGRDAVCERRREQRHRQCDGEHGLRERLRGEGGSERSFDRGGGTDELEQQDACGR